jgi:hypothetical protein
MLLRRKNQETETEILLENVSLEDQEVDWRLILRLASL